MSCGSHEDDIVVDPLDNRAAESPGVRNVTAPQFGLLLRSILPAPAGSGARARSGKQVRPREGVVVSRVLDIGDELLSGSREVD